jgi:hypothetical protein
MSSAPEVVIEKITASLAPKSLARFRTSYSTFPENSTPSLCRVPTGDETDGGDSPVFVEASVHNTNAEIPLRKLFNS